MKIIVFGAGAWGTAMALSAAAHPAGHGVTLWARDAGQAAAMQAARQNARYLPGIAFPAVLGLASGAPFEALASCQADLAIVATPMSGLRGMLEELRAASVPVAWLCKGFEAVPASGEAAAQGLMAHEICSQVAPQLRAGALSGPSFALEAAQGRPTALVAASRDARVRELLVEAFHGPTLRVYANEDIVGVEVGGGCEECAGHCHRAVRRAGPGHERARRAHHAGAGRDEPARPCTRRAGGDVHGAVRAGRPGVDRDGGSVPQPPRGPSACAGAHTGSGSGVARHVAEGVYSARTVVRRARQLGVDMPIAQEVVALLDGRSTASEAVARLMGRGPAVELRSC